MRIRTEIYRYLVLFFTVTRSVLFFSLVHEGKGVRGEREVEGKGGKWEYSLFLYFFSGMSSKLSFFIIFLSS